MKTLLFFTTSILVLVSSIFGLTDREARAQRRSSISEVTFEEVSAWQGLMAKYVLRRNGTALMIGPDVTGNSPDGIVYTGTFTGFDALAEEISSEDFFGLQPKYSLDEDDVNVMTVSVTRDGRRTVVVDVGGVGPQNLHRITDKIRKVVKPIKWKRSGAFKPNSP